MHNNKKHQREVLKGILDWLARNRTQIHDPKTNDYVSRIPVMGIMTRSDSDIIPPECVVFIGQAYGIYVIGMQIPALKKVEDWLYHRRQKPIVETSCDEIAGASGSTVLNALKLWHHILAVGLEEKSSMIDMPGGTMGEVIDVFEKEMKL